MIDLPVLGSMIPGKMAPPWQLYRVSMAVTKNKGYQHRRDDATTGIHLRGDALQTLGIGVIDQRGVSSRSEEKAILFDS